MNKLICGDCIEEMTKLPPNSIDLIISDYPFNCQDGRKDYLQFIEYTTKEFLRIAKPICNLVVINNPHNVFKSSQYYQKDWVLVNSIVLIRKGSLRPAWPFGFQHNCCLILNRGGIKSKWNGAKINHDKNFPTDVIPYQNGYRGKGKMWHPQALPLSLVRMFINTLSNEKDTVLDCFMGSGTTGVICKELNRDFIGIEVNPNYYQMSKNRVLNEEINP